MLTVQYLGRRSLSEMEKRVDALAAKREDRILLFEPQPTFRYSHVHDLASLRVHSAEFARYCKTHGIAHMVHTHDGGGILYHGPGQLVMYLSLCMPTDFHPRHLRSILQIAMIRFLDYYGIKARTNDTVYGSQGVWVDDCGELRKIGFLGARFSLKINGEKIVSRGCAVNISPNLEPFDLIDPCDLPGVHVSSVDRLIGKAPKIDMTLARTFAKIFVDVLGEHLGKKIGLEFSKYS